MRKSALVSAASYGHNSPRVPGSHHGTSFNGWDEERAKLYEGTFIRSERKLDSARVTKIWDPDKETAKNPGDACGIETVTDTPEECSEGEDVVPIEGEAGLIAALEAGKLSLELGREVTIEELLE